MSPPLKAQAFLLCILIETSTATLEGFDSDRSLLETQSRLISGQHFLVTATDFAPYSFLKEGSVSGSHYEVLLAASARYNFSFRLDLVKNKSTGVLLPNGSWTGMMGDITRGQYHIALVLAATPERIRDADFSSPIGVSHLYFVSNRPKKYISSLALLTPLQGSVWSLILLLLLVTAVGIFLMAQLRREVSPSFFQVLTWLLALSAEQPSMLPRDVRSLGVIWTLLVLTVGTGYKSNLASFLTKPSLVRKPCHLEQLQSNYSHYKLFLDLSGITGYNYFKNGRHPLLQEIRKRLIPTSTSADCLLSTFLEGDESVCIGWDVSLPLALASNLSRESGSPQELMYSGAPFHFIYASLVLRKGLPYLHLFDTLALRVAEGGLVRKWEADAARHHGRVGRAWRRDMRKSGTTLSQKFMDVQERRKRVPGELVLQHFLIPLWLVVGSSVLAFLVFILELIFC